MVDLLVVVVKSGKGSLSEWWWGCPTLGGLGGTGPSDGGAPGRGTAMRLRGFATVWGVLSGGIDGLEGFWLDFGWCFWRKCHKTCCSFAGGEVVVYVFMIIVVVSGYRRLISRRFYNILRRLFNFHSSMEMDELGRPSSTGYCGDAA